MSNEVNTKMMEELEVWLEENQFWAKDIKFDNKFYFERGAERIELPDNLQQICLLLKNS